MPQDAAALRGLVCGVSTASASTFMSHRNINIVVCSFSTGLCKGDFVSAGWGLTSLSSSCVACCGLGDTTSSGYKCCRGCCSMLIFSALDDTQRITPFGRLSFPITMQQASRVLMVCHHGTWSPFVVAMCFSEFQEVFLPPTLPGWT